MFDYHLATLRVFEYQLLPQCEPARGAVYHLAGVLTCVLAAEGASLAASCCWICSSCCFCMRASWAWCCWYCSRLSTEEDITESVGTHTHTPLIVGLNGLKQTHSDDEVNL